MLDLGYFRRPPFVGSNFVAFATYFGTFSIFFFTALYLQVVGDGRPYQHRSRLPAHGRRHDPGLGADRSAGWPAPDPGCP